MNCSNFLNFRIPCPRWYCSNGVRTEPVTKTTASTDVSSTGEYVMDIISHIPLESFTSTERSIWTGGSPLPNRLDFSPTTETGRGSTNPSTSSTSSRIDYVPIIDYITSTVKPIMDQFNFSQVNKCYDQTDNWSK